MGKQAIAAYHGHIRNTFRNLADIRRYVGKGKSLFAVCAPNGRQGEYLCPRIIPAEVFIEAPAVLFKIAFAGF